MKCCRDALSEATTIQITLGGNDVDIQVIKPMAARDSLYVEYTPKAIGSALSYMRLNGFAEKREPYFQHQGSQAIRKRKNGYVVVSKENGGKLKYKKAKTLDDAVNPSLFSSQQEAEVGEHSCAEEAAGEYEIPDDAVASDAEDKDADGSDAGLYDSLVG